MHSRQRNNMRSMQKMATSAVILPVAATTHDG